MRQYISDSISDIEVLPAPSGLSYTIYSPDLFDGVLYLGGWLTAADVGPDQLYQSSPTTDEPTRLVWNGWVPYSQYHLNDPSVVRESNGTLAMFMTALPNADDSVTMMQYYNQTGLAISTDNGASWTWEGIVIGQNNGCACNGAWSPSAVVQSNTDIAVWYNTGSKDMVTGIDTQIQVLRTTMNPTGTKALGTQACVNALTGQAISAENVSVTQASDGTYWMVGNDYSWTGGGSGKIVMYESQDGINWVPWSTAGATLVAPTNGQLLLTPTITSITGTTLTLMYAENLTGSTSTIKTMTVNLSNQPTTSNFLEAFVFNGAESSSIDMTGQAYSGPVAGLQNELIYTGGNNVNMVALTPNVFLRGGSGDDALVAQSGNNVLDGGAGSNFLGGGSGDDVFFLEANTGATVWSTLSNFHAGDQVTIWGPTSSYNIAWAANQGAAGYQGATLHIPMGGGATASLTIAGYSVAAAQKLSAAFGSIDGLSYLHLAA